MTKKNLFMCLIFFIKNKILLQKLRIEIHSIFNFKKIGLTKNDGCTPAK